MSRPFEKWERERTYNSEMQDLLIAMEAAMSVTDPPLTSFEVSGKVYKLTLERITAANQPPSSLGYGDDAE